MMFYALCISMLLAVTFLVMAVTTLASLPLINRLGKFAARVGQSGLANLLLAVRLLPLFLGLAVSLGLALPAFLEFEPQPTAETPGALLLLLAGLGFATLGAIVYRGFQGLHATWRFEREALGHAELLSASHEPVKVFRVSGRSLLAVTGILRPRILVSEDVAQTLTAGELAAALLHEISHVRAWDNLKQLLLRMTRLPLSPGRPSPADVLWAISAELAADERAIAQGASALELASALVKVGRLSRSREQTALLAASHLVDHSSSSTHLRAARLHDLLVNPSPPHGPRPSTRGWLLLAGAGLWLYLLILATMLPAIHEALEFLVH